jgi:hypothetical protein
MEGDVVRYVVELHLDPVSAVQSMQEEAKDSIL